MGELISVTCNDEFDPPFVTITIAFPQPIGYYSFNVPKNYYDAIRGPLNYPPNPCED